MKNSEYLILILLIYMDVIFGAMSKSIPNNNSPEIEKQTFSAACNSVEFLLNSNFTKSCVREPTAINERNAEDIKPETLLCFVVNDLGLKWCSRNSQNLKLPEIANAEQFDSYVSKFGSFDNIKNYCATPKNSMSANQTYLKIFYNDMVTCLQYCLDPSTGNKEFRKICYALAWLEATINLPEKILETQSKVSETKSETDNKALVKTPEVQSIQEQNIEAKTDGGKKTVVDAIETTTSTKENVTEFVNKQVDVPKTQRVPISTEQRKEQLSEGQTNPEKISRNQNIPDVNNNNQGEQIPSKDNQNSVPVILDNHKDLLPQQENLEVPVIESTEIKPDVNRTPEASVSRIDKKTESSTGKAGKEQKSEGIKSSTLSDNTNDIIDNPDLPREDGDVSSLGNNEDDQTVDIGLPNPEPEFTVERKITRFPGKEAEEESHIFSYFVVFSLLFVCCYIGYYNKKKILAILLEGRRSRNGRGRRRPSTANYRKLDCNLEEAVTSQCNSNVTHVIY